MAVDRDKVLQAAQKLVEKKRYDKAIVEYQKLVVDDPKDVRTLLKIGDLYLKMEQHADAIGTYERVGQFYSTQGFHLKAIAVYKQIREIIHKHVPHLEDRFGHIVPKLAETYAELGLTSDALAAYDEIATRYQRAGRERDAIDVFRKIVEIDPQNPLPHLRLAEASMRVKDVDNAIQRFGAAAEILLKLGRRDDALKVVERLLQHRADAKFARIAAEIYLDRGEPADAMAALAKLQICFKENPKDLGTLALLARSFDKLGQPTKSIEVQKEAARIAKDAGKVDHFNALVEALLARAPQDEGVRQLAAMRSQHAPARQTAEPPRSSNRDVAPQAISARAEPRSGMPSTVEVEVEDFVEEDEPASAVPFPLKPSSPPTYDGGPIPRIPGPPATPGTHATHAEKAAVDPAVRVRHILAQVDVARRARDYDKALSLLFSGVDELPGARELREKLCDVLIEAGDQAEAVHQMLALAQWLASTDDVEGATRILDEVLLLDPTQADAIAMLRELGYTVGEEEEAVEEVAYTAPETDQDGYDPSAPLPAYDLDEVGGVAVPSNGASHAFVPGQLDDPFGEGPLPSFPMEDDAPAYAQGDAPEFAMLEPEMATSVGSMGASGPSGALDEEALDEVEFFASNNMFDEARNLLEEQLAKLPNHPLLLERLRELEEHAASAQGGGSGTRAVPRSVEPTHGAPSSHSREDRAFDIAASLDALDALDAGPQPAPIGDPSQVSVESVFQQFKAGVAAQISESDAATHYELGVAYKEMGLVSDAIAEFELAARDPGRECACHSTIGMIYREHGNVDAAISSFIRGLHAQNKTHDQELALTYEIGDCYEERRAPDQALHYFQRVARMNPGYDDMRGSVAERIRRLDSPKGAPAKAVGAENVDEFDAVLDDLLGGAKLP